MFASIAMGRIEFKQVSAIQHGNIGLSILIGLLSVVIICPTEVVSKLI